MTKYIVYEEIPVTSVWIYEVHAETEEEAIEVVKRGEAEHVTYEQITEQGGDPTYTVEKG